MDWFRASWTTTVLIRIVLHRGLAGNRTLSCRLRAECSAIELRARGRHGNRTRLSQIKGLLPHLEANLPLLVHGSCLSLFMFTSWGLKESNLSPFKATGLQPADSTSCLFRPLKCRKPPGAFRVAFLPLPSGHPYRI